MGLNEEPLVTPLAESTGYMAHSMRSHVFLFNTTNERTWGKKLQGIFSNRTGVCYSVPAGLVVSGAFQFGMLF